MRTILIVIGFLALLAAPAARGATVTATSTYVDAYKGSGDWDTVVTVTAAPGEANDLHVASVSHLTTVHDAGAPLTAGDGCHTDSDGVACDVKDNYTLGRVQVHAGDGDDHVTLDGGSGEIHGEDGDDVLTGPGRLDGGPGDDTLTGGEPVTIYDGGPGNDVMTGTGGYDQILDYADHAAGVTVTLGATTGNGSPGEDDVISGMSEVIGGPGDDTLTGDDALNELTGGAGDDRLDGGGGRDLLYGGTGRNDGTADVILGGDGPDVLETGPRGSADGGAGDDTIVARGAATLTGGPGADSVETIGAGATVRLGDDEPDRLTCGGTPLSRVDLDPRDSTLGCAGRWLHRAGGPAPVTYALTRRRWVAHVLGPALRLICPEDAAGGVCPVRVTLTAGRAVAGRAALRVRVDDHDAVLPVPLSRAVTRELLRGHHLTAALTVSTRDGAGRVHSTRGALCLTRLGPHAGACA
jgi:Ca2+-binding RTX toxin-like protein